MAGLMPGEWDWMSRDPFLRGPGGFGAPTDSPGGILGQPQQGGIRGLLGDPGFALSLLAASGPSPEPRSFGQILGQSALHSMGARQQREQENLKRQYMQAQIEHMKRPDRSTSPASVQEYEYARQNGFKGSFQDWIVAGGQSSRPSSVQEWEFYQSLPAEMQKRYLEMKRNPNMVVKDVGGVPTVVAPTVVAGTSTTPLSSLPQEAAAASALKEAGAIGTARGEVKGALEKKGVNAQSVLGTLDIADPLIDIATGSATGAARDKVAAFFGEAPDGAQAIAQLRVLQANLMTNMPRMEGPQSDADVKLYREAAGEIGDPTVPRAQKKAALQAIRQIQERYAGGAGGAKPTARYQEGQTATNPQTGEKLTFRGGRWQKQ